jgi:hypothetical protein
VASHRIHLLKEVAPDKPTKWVNWAEKLAEEDIETENDLLELAEEDFSGLPVSAALKSVLRKFRSSIQKDSTRGGNPEEQAAPVAPAGAEFSLRVLDVKVAAGVFLSQIHGLKQIVLVSLVVACASIEDIVDGVQNKARASLYFAQNHVDPSVLGSTSHDESGSITIYTEGWIPVENSLYHILNRLLRDSDRTKLIPCFPYLKLLLTALLHRLGAPSPAARTRCRCGW